MPISRIKTDGIQDDAVTSAKIGTSVIVADDLDANSVTVSEIQDGAVTSAKLDTNIDISGTLDVTGVTTLDDGLVVDNDGATVATFDRATSDGTIIDLQKDGSSVGSIDVDGAYLTFNNSAVKLGKAENGQLLLLTATETGTPRLAPVADDAVNIGNTSTRFKDAYLSGGVYLGGTGAANYLDDYEEGTWTPVVNGENQTGSDSSNVYVKIGRLVFVCVDMTLSVTSGANNTITGLPFAPANNYTGTFTAGYHNDSSTSNPIVGIANPTGGGRIDLYHGSTSRPSLDNNERIIISGTYYTDS